MENFTNSPELNIFFLDLRVIRVLFVQFKEIYATYLDKTTRFQQHSFQYMKPRCTYLPNLRRARGFFFSSLGQSKGPFKGSHRLEIVTKRSPNAHKHLRNTDTL